MRRRRVIGVRAVPGASRPTGRRDDLLAVEEPLEVRVNGESFSVTMRTPGDDFDLVAGFLVSEGLIATASQLRTMRYCSGRDESGVQTYNVIDAALDATAALPATASARHVYTSSSCGICGTASIDAVSKASRFSLADDHSVIGIATLLRLPTMLRENQTLFDRTGGVHAAGLFTTEGDLLCLREDVGRHNAVDKVIGWALRDDRLPLRGVVLQVSGRASFELVQKAQLAGIPVLAAVSAPSSLAADLADTGGLTLAAFSRGDSINVYTHPERVGGIDAGIDGDAAPR